MNEVLQKIGFNTGHILKVLLLQQTSKAPINAKELHTLYTKSFPNVTVGYEYVAKIAKQLEIADAITIAHTDKQKKYYSITTVGKEILSDYEKLYHGQFAEILNVLERVTYELTKKGIRPPPFENPLPTEFRRFFAKLISVRDITRAMIFKLGQNRTEFYAAEAIEQMNEIFGWAPSNGYFYDVVREMEAEQTIVGKWKDPEKRTIRLIKITEDGLVFSKQVRNSLSEQVLNVRGHLQSIMALFN